tara:strand:+ start:5925 stop:7148 length:1224 start_codon:yes stop_codon:yes gene_type:complete
MTEFFVQKSPLLNTANRNYTEQFASNAQYSTGGTINIKVPGYQNVTTGLATTAQDITDKIVPYTIDSSDLYNISNELDLLSEHFEVVGGRNALTKMGQQAVVDNYCKPIFLSLEAKLEAVAATRMQQAAYITPIDEPSKLGSLNSYSDISEVEELMTDLKYQTGERYAVLNPRDGRGVFDSMQNMFNTVINTKITETARLGGKGRLASFDMYTCADIPEHTVGEQFATSPTFTVGAVATNGSTITFAGVAAVGTRLIKAGDRISIPTVTLLDQVSKAVRKWKLVVTAAADASGDGAGNVTVTLSEPLVATGMNANVSALPAVAAAAELFPSHRLNFFYVPSGLSAVPLALKDISGADNSANNLKPGQVPVKTVIQGSVSAFTNTFRTSILCGIKAFSGYIIVLPTAI